MNKKNKEDLATISSILDRKDKDIHTLTLEILSKYNFENNADITTLADNYSDNYIKVYNFLVKKYNKTKKKAGTF
ncbi:hypothetical protein [Fuchsiella alkaliacetigena]|uniref:hypothetical protein n=1 Tax=Fuchsiella alkaliacetigena TaxID=957042 RepID=UPI00200B192D|nr:hypothetical protein [Fuchsiella alkaliacetigena]MCK8824697.1 hypothetical protein [Fuchsiella alkaliacetigena]